MGKFIIYSQTDFAKLRGVDRRTVHNWIKKKKKDLNVVMVSGVAKIKVREESTDGQDKDN